MAYLLVGGAVWFGVDPIRRVLLLPALFSTATRALVLAVLPVALAVAWRYPGVGGASSQEDPTEPQDSGSGSSTPQ